MKLDTSFITKINEGSVDVKILSQHNVTTDTWSEIDYEEGSSTKSFLGYDAGVEQFITGIANQDGFNNPNLYRIFDNAGSPQKIERTRFQANVGLGSTMISFGEDLNTQKVSFGDEIKSVNGTYSGTVIGFTTEGATNSLSSWTLQHLLHSLTQTSLLRGIDSGLTLRQGNTAEDWYNMQTLGLANQTIYWKSLAERPATSAYAADRSSRFDEIHVVVVDDTGKVTGSAGNIVEKWVGLSKAR